MSELDPRSEDVLAQLRASWEPPAGVEERLLAAIHARIDGDGGPDDGGSEPGGESDGGPPPAGSGELPLAAKLGYAAKVVGATAMLTAAGLALLVGTSELIRKPTPAPVSVAASPAEGNHSTPPAATRAEPPVAIADTSPPPREEPVLAAPARPHSTRSQLASSRTVAPVDPEVPNPDSTLEAELALLRTAKTSSPREALGALELHAEQFPAGILAREREGLHIRTLCQLGRNEDAQRLLTPFAAADPRSLQLPSLRESCPNLNFPPTDSATPGD